MHVFSSALFNLAYLAMEGVLYVFLAIRQFTSFDLGWKSMIPHSSYLLKGHGLGGQLFVSIDKYLEEKARKSAMPHYGYHDHQCPEFIKVPG